jgi:hypothetical protein
MKNKGFLKVWIFSLMGMAAAGLICSSAFGQITQTISSQWGNLLNSNSLNSSIFISPLAQSSTYALTTANPFSSSSVNSSTYASPFAQGSSYSSTTANPFATTSNQLSSSSNLFSTAWDQSSSYQNAFGFGYSTGSDFYTDPFHTTGGGYVNVGAPGSSYSSASDYSRTPLGGSSSSSESLILPWTTYASDVSTSYGMDAFPYTNTFSGTSLAVGTPTIYSGLGRYGEGIANLVSYAPISGQLDQMLGNQVMYTSEGMPFVPTASYFNPYNESNYFFAPGVQTTVAGVMPTAGVGSSSLVTGTATARLGGIAGYSGVVGGGYTGGGYGGYAGYGGYGGAGGGYPGAGGGYAGAGGGYPGGLAVGGTGSPAAGGFSAAGFSAVVSPVP